MCLSHVRGHTHTQYELHTYHLQKTKSLPSLTCTAGARSPPLHCTCFLLLLILSHLGATPFIWHVRYFCVLYRPPPTHTHKYTQVFEIEIGQVDRGAEMKWISQFPGEEEVVMPPLSNLEVIGAPYLTRLDGKIILIVPLRVNVNIKSKTMGELISTRKDVLLSVNSHPKSANFANLFKTRLGKVVSSTSSRRRGAV